MQDSLLITGPPASGKSRVILERFLESSGSTLIVPSATMAEHVRNELARAGVAIQPSRITTLAHLLEQINDSLTPASPAILHILIARALERLRLPRFAAVASFPGFHRALSDLIEEVSSNAFSGPFADELARISRDVEERLAECGMALRNERLRRTKPAIHAPVFWDGFFTFSPAEIEFIETLAAQTPVTVTLPDWPGASASRAQLLRFGFRELRLEQVLREPRRTVMSSPTLEQEVEEIARRIIAQGRAFRDIGIILRVRDPYCAALETALARFGIPARFYFTNPLSSHPAMQCLSGIVRSLLSGWDHESLLMLLRMPVSGLGATPEGDRLDFELRERLPASGLPFPGLDRLSNFDLWRRDRFEPEQWADRLKTLRTLLPFPEVADGCSREQVQIWRSTAAALRGFDTVLSDVAIALKGTGKISLAEFWRHTEIALSVEQLRIPDRRRNVVHVLDVYEARQWELPIIFLCGLNERHFPQYHREDPLLNDAARRRAGLLTSQDMQAEEQFLFGLATTRATEEIVLSYARFTSSGDAALRSFFLGNAEDLPCDTRVRPAPSSPAPPVSTSAIDDPALRDRLRTQHKTLSPTSIEKFLQCPFQFFASTTLRLRERPAKPRDRLDVLMQGSILHKALAEYPRSPLLGTAWLDQIFDDECSRARIPRTYRTEAVRLELLRHFETFLLDRSLKLTWPSRVEEKFTYPLTPELSIRGRIDRLDVSPAGQALVIDYKYSAQNKIRERVEDHAAGNLVQGGLYLLAAERAFGLKPAAMFYCGLRKKVSWHGWHTSIPGVTFGENCTPAALREFIDVSSQRAIETFETILSGRVAPHPSDPDACRWCDFRYICRTETLDYSTEHSEGAGGE